MVLLMRLDSQVWFNDIEPFPCQWIRNHFPAAIVDQRDIKDISATELKGITRAHFFAGIGGWEVALNLAGFPDDFEVWTGSCPCQPFSNAGKRKGFDDARHLWPIWLQLISECKPPIIIGEQVSSKNGRLWISRVQADLEKLGYLFGVLDLCAAGLGAPHIRQRLYWMAYSTSPRFDWRKHHSPEFSEEWGRNSQSKRQSIIGWLGDPSNEGFEGDKSPQSERETWEKRGSTTDAGSFSPWANSKYIQCMDNRKRRIPIESSFQPLANDGRFGNPRIHPELTSRTNTLKAIGNSIVVPVAVEFIRSVMETLDQFIDEES